MYGYVGRPEVLSLLQNDKMYCCSNKLVQMILIESNCCVSSIIVVGCCSFLPHFVILEGHVRATDGVPEDEKRPVVAHIMGVVVIVHVCPGTEGEVSKRAEPEVVATVPVNAFQRPDHQPHPQRADVGSEQHGTQEYPQGVDEGVFKEVGIFHRPAVGLLVAMVEFVYVFVEKGRVQCSVEPIEAKVLDEEEEGEMDNKLQPVCVCAHGIKRGVALNDLVLSKLDIGPRGMYMCIVRRITCLSHMSGVCLLHAYLYISHACHMTHTMTVKTL